MRKSYSLTVFVLLVTLLLSACSSKTTVTSEPSSSSSTEPKEIVIGLSVPDLSSSFWTSIVYGAQSEADRLGVKLQFVNAGGDTKVQDQISQIQNLIQKKVNVLIVGATDGMGVVPIVEQAIAKGIPVVGISSVPQTNKLISAVGTDNFKMGQLLAEALGDALKGTGEIAMMSGPAGQEWATKRADGFKIIMKAKYPNIKIVSEDHTGDNRNAALTLMQDWLQRFPDIKGIYTATDDIGAGAADAIAAANKTGSVLVASSNLSPVGVDYLKKGLIAFETTQKVVTQGIATVEQAVKAAKGERTIENVVTDIIFVDKSNIDKIDFSSVSAPKDFKP
jgi:TMAO reductase system protein TorT